MVSSLWERVRPPLWARWTVSLLVGAAAVVALVLFVNHNPAGALAHLNPKAVRREVRQAEVVVGQDQAPVTRTVRAGQSAAASILAGVRADMRRRIATGNVQGPLQRSSCRATGHQGGRTAYRCLVVAADVNYPFLAIAGTHPGRVTFCKRDLPPIPSENIPVSPRCRL